MTGTLIVIAPLLSQSSSAIVAAYIYIYILGGEVLEHWDRQPQKGVGREGIILYMADVLKQLRLSNLTDLVKMFLFHGFEPPGCRKSNSLMKNDSFWWGERLRTFKIRLFYIFVIFVHMLLLSPYIYSYAVTIGVYLYICCDY